MRGAIWVTWCCLALAPAAQGTENPWTIDDFATADSDSGGAISPDGSAVAWVRSQVSEVAGVERPTSHLRLARLSAPDPLAETSVRLTRGVEQMENLKFSPDGRWLGFLSDRAASDESSEVGSVQLWVVSLAGGEPFAVTRFDRDVLDYGWIDGSTFVVAAQESPSERERAANEAGDDSIAVDDPADAPPIRLFRVTFGESGEESVRRLTTERVWIDSLSVSPDGRRAVALASQSRSFGFDQKVPPHTLLVDLEAGRSERILADGKLLPQGVRWSPDSRGFYFTNERSSHPVYRMATVSDLWYFDLTSGKPTAIDLGWERGLAGPVEPLADGFLARLADGTRFKAVRYQRDPRTARWSRRDLLGVEGGEIEEWTVSHNGKSVLYRASTSVRPPASWVARLEGARLTQVREVIAPPSSWQGKSAGKSELVRWKGARGETVEGILLYPLDAVKKGERRPLILAVHGGPTDVDTDTWRTEWGLPDVLWRARGAYVLRVNYHGSGGYGLEWAESIVGRYYELEIPDLETGVDAMIARGLADPERLGCAGWSNGGILCAELITRTRRYKAASIGAADVEWFSDWANVDFGAAFDNYYFGGPPWERVEHYLAKSPFFRLAAVTTPTIVFTGTADTNVPPHQSMSLFRALQQIGKAPTRLLQFPEATHGLDRVAHVRRKMTEELAWFDRYLFGREPRVHSAIPEGSPLESRVVAARAARVGGAYGVESAGGILAPEIVRFGGFDIARFEVTRAQFAAFDPTSQPALGMVGMENFPAIVPFERARAYAEWLAKREGRPFRLPSEAEARELAEAGASDGGNSLDRWLGYTPNPEDLAEVRTTLATLPTGTLLAEVGRSVAVSSGDTSGDASGDAVFDLDGNAAEWAVTEGGAGVAVGPSADLPDDPRSLEIPAPEYTGFRVVAPPRASQLSDPLSEPSPPPS